MFDGNVCSFPFGMPFPRLFGALSADAIYIIVAGIWLHQHADDGAEAINAIVRVETPMRHARRPDDCSDRARSTGCTFGSSN